MVRRVGNIPIVWISKFGVAAVSFLTINLTAEVKKHLSALYCKYCHDLIFSFPPTISTLFAPRFSIAQDDAETIFRPV